MWRFIFLIFILFHDPLSAQNTIGLPDIINYAKQQYAGGGQNWDVSIGPNGRMYFANTEGLLTFDGHFWKMYGIPNKTCVRSVNVDSNGRVYVGAQDEFGYYFPDRSGTLRYHSLRHLLPTGKRQLADVWDIELHGDIVFFRTNDRILAYQGDTIIAYPATLEWRKMYKTTHGLYAQERRQGLLQYEDGVWRTVCNDPVLENILVTALMDDEYGNLLITTLKDGLFTITGNRLQRKRTEADAIFYSGRIYCAIPLSDEELAIGTTSNGCYILNRQSGKLVQRFGMDEGLQNNNVLQLFADERRNIWLALDNGIGLVRYNTFIKQIYPDKKNLLTTYTASVHNNRLYLGTSDGVYSTLLDGATDFSNSKNSFEFVQNTNGQVWNLASVNGRLLLGHHEGTLLIEENKATSLLNNEGCWLFKTSAASSDQVLIGTYHGLYEMSASGNGITKPHYLPGLMESLRFLVQGNNNTVWSSHPYRGIYKITTGKEGITYTLYTAKNGLPSDYENYVFRLKGNPVIATKNGLYEYNEKKDSFQRSSLYPILGNTAIQFLTEDAKGNIWFISNKRPGIVDFKKPSNGNPYTIIYFPELKQQIVSGFEFIYPYNEENVFLAAEKGIFHINYRKYLQTAAGPAISIGKVIATGKTDSLIFGGYFADEHRLLTRQNKSINIELPHAWHNFRFEFASPAADQGSGIEYSYQLAGFDNGWSEWAPKTEKEYTNLPYGRYVFIVKARDNLGHLSPPVEYTFTILPAWYQTTTARAIYALLLISLLFLLYKRQKRKFAVQQIKHRKEQEHLISLHQLELERNEKELIKVQNEKLATEVHFKNRELATVTMHLVQRGKVLSDIKEKLVQTIRKHEPALSMSNFRRVMHLFEEAENNEEDWEHFSKHFDEVHSNYLTLVKKHFPQLTTTDLKLCAYLHIHLTSKEIAQLMGISVRGVETSRYRLRKKLNIPGEISLNTFLLEAISQQGPLHKEAVKIS